MKILHPRVEIVQLRQDRSASLAASLARSTSLLLIVRRVPSRASASLCDRAKSRKLAAYVAFGFTPPNLRSQSSTASSTSAYASRSSSNGGFGASAPNFGTNAHGPTTWSVGLPMPRVRRRRGSWVAPRCVPGGRRFDGTRFGIPTRAREPSFGVGGATRLEIGADVRHRTPAALYDLRGVFSMAATRTRSRCARTASCSNARRRSSAVLASSSVLSPAMDARSVGRARREMRLNS